jgi:tRNA nucleotidyltransferase (CCA-adding enzyme)
LEKTKMEIYLVGGAVRDELLDLQVKDRDWVVVGSTANEMLKKGYRQVGKDFPVFLEPKTHEEYALARVERKVGRGYTGFDFDASPEVTIEQDLQRRDLTINAIAKRSDGSLVDPYHGEDDIHIKILRHVSPAFVEDPVRILRVARFAARFDEFTVADETIALMQEMVKSGEVDALVAERVWKELERAIQEKAPAKFFHVLAKCNALSVLFPALKKNNITALTQAAESSTDAEVRFAALLYDLSPEEIRVLCDRYRVPSAYRELALLVALYCQDYFNGGGLAVSHELTASQGLALLQSTDAFRRESRFNKFLEVCDAVSSRKFPEWSSSVRWSVQEMRSIYNVARKADAKKIVETGVVGKDVAEALSKQRLDLIQEFLEKKNK